MKKALIIPVALVITLTVTIASSDTIVRVPQVSQMDRQTLAYSPGVTDGHPSVCQMTNGTYVLVYGKATQVNMRLSDDPTDFSTTNHVVVNRPQPDIQCWNGSLWITVTNTGGDDSIEIWNCSESDDVTDSANWNLVSTPVDSTYVATPPQDWFYVGPCDASLYMFDEPVNGHKFWVECLDHNGSGESNDCDRYIFYSDDITADDWNIGNNEEAVLKWLVSGQGNWPVDCLYIPEANGWIVANSFEDNESTSANMSSIYYAWTNNINTTWNKTWVPMVPRDVNVSTNIDDFMTCEPDMLLIGNRIYVYYSYLADGQANNNNRKVVGVTTLLLSAFTDPDFEFQKVSGAKNNGYFPVNTQFQFNWTNATGAQQYQVQVSNSSDFSTTFINATVYPTADIMSEPGASFTYKGDYVEINLPFSYNLTYEGTHYYRVRAGYHSP